MSEAGYDAWIGRSETATDTATAAPITGLAALLDEEIATGPGAVVPPLGHWLYFLPTVRRSDLDDDGHPRRDAASLLPPINLPRRMWAGGRLWFERDIPLGAVMERRSTIRTISRKRGRSGDLVFVTLLHELGVGGRRAIREEQDLVYRAAAAASSDPPVSHPPALPDGQRRSFGPVDLFRYSALTCNAHRIHYDRDYARAVEGYPGLVVQGPLLATVALRHWLAARSDGVVRRFAFRAERPLFAGDPFDLLADDAGARLCHPDGSTLMRIEVG